MSKISDFSQKFVLQVGVKSAILRFKAKDEVLSSTLNSHNHIHIVIYLTFYVTIERCEFSFYPSQVFSGRAKFRFSDRSEFF